MITVQIFFTTILKKKVVRSDDPEHPPKDDSDTGVGEQGRRSSYSKH